MALLSAPDPPVDYFLHLYRSIGAPWHWTDWLEKTRAEQEDFVSDPAVTLHSMMFEGWPGGFFILDTRSAGICDISYFGLAGAAQGRGLGRWLLGQAIATGWDRPGSRRSRSTPARSTIRRRSGSISAWASRPSGAPSTSA